MGKVKIPIEILNKPGALMRKHAAVDVAYNHHERIDGNGYPRKLPGPQIPYYAKLIAIVDTYDAISSDRSYSKGRASMEALDIIYRFRGTQFEDELAKAFIRMIGIYPSGSIVELHTGEVAIVTSQNRGSRLKPKLKIVLDGTKAALDNPRPLDLITEPKDAAVRTYTISKELSDGSFGVKLQSYLDAGTVLDYVTS